MTITTKYNPGDQLWIMKNNRPELIQIYEIVIPKIPTINKYSVRYTLTGYNGASQNYNEREFFKTKEELLNSL